jgi:hypothetical protein
LADACGRDFGVDWIMHVLFGVIWLGVTASNTAGASKVVSGALHIRG